MRQLLAATLVLLAIAAPAHAQFASEQDHREALRFHRNGHSRLGEAHNNLAALYARKADAEAAARAAQKAGFRLNPRLLNDIKNLPSAR